MIDEKKMAGFNDAPLRDILIGVNAPTLYWISEYFDINIILLIDTLTFYHKEYKKPLIGGFL